MAQPKEIRAHALEQLEDLRAALHSWAFLRALKRRSQEKRDQAAQLMLDVAFARQVLATAALEDILNELRSNEDELSEASKNLKNALSQLNRVSAVLDEMTEFLTVLRKVITII